MRRQSVLDLHRKHVPKPTPRIFYTSFLDEPGIVRDLADPDRASRMDELANFSERTIIIGSLSPLQLAHYVQQIGVSIDENTKFFDEFVDNKQKTQRN
jgi:hypothetical protein